VEVLKMKIHNQQREGKRGEEPPPILKKKNAAQRHRDDGGREKRGVEASMTIPSERKPRQKRKKSVT